MSNPTRNLPPIQCALAESLARAESRLAKLRETLAEQDPPGYQADLDFLIALDQERLASNPRYAAQWDKIRARRGW